MSAPLYRLNFEKSFSNKCLLCIKNLFLTDVYFVLRISVQMSSFKIQRFWRCVDMSSQSKSSLRYVYIQIITNVILNLLLNVVVEYVLVATYSCVIIIGIILIQSSISHFTFIVVDFFFIKYLIFFPRDKTIFIPNLIKSVFSDLAIKT